jgi:uncharacterized membrane protein
MSPGALLTIGLLSLAASPRQGPPEEQAPAVARLLEAKCAECHVPEAENAKAKRHFDSALDLPRVVEDYVVAGDLLMSELWSQIESQEMPPEDARAGPLSVAERELVREWIVAGAPLPSAGPPELPELTDGSDTKGTSAPRKRAGWSSSRWVVWLGRLHPSLVHFPIAFLLGAGLLELLLLLHSSSGAAQAARVLVRMGAFFAPVAAALGWINALDSAAGREGLEWHRWLGISTAGLCAPLLLFSELAAREGARRRAYRVLLFATWVTVGWGGHLGGELVLGKDYLPF